MTFAFARRLRARRNDPTELETVADELAISALLAPAESAQEAEAKRLRGSKSNRAVKPLLPTPLPALSGSGTALDAGVRFEMAQRFNHDFSRVRVRSDAAAAQSAGRLGARAFTVGDELVFAEGQFAPAQPEGRRLLAHELAHVVQTGRGQPARLMSKKDPNAKPFYQSVLDAFNKAKGDLERAIKPIVQLCEAIDQEQTRDIAKRMDALVKLDAYVLPPNFPSGTLATEVMTRLVLLGQGQAASRFSTWYINLPHIKGPSHNYAQRYYDDEDWYWHGVLEALRERVDWKDAAAALKLLDGLFTFFRQIERVRAALDAKAVLADLKRLNQFYTPGEYSRGFGMESSPNISIALYHGRLTELLRDTFIAMQRPFQVVLERAAEDLAAGKGDALLKAAEKGLTSVLDQVRLPKEAIPTIETGETIWETVGKQDVLRQVDYFLEAKAARKRSIKLESYDETTRWLYVRPSQLVDYRRIVAIRHMQVDALKRIFGLEKDAKGKPTADAKENQAALKALGGDGLQLHSDEDWRKFLRAKFDLHMASSKSAEESLESVIELLKTYLHAFTTHSPFNIDDFGDNLLKLQFPRTLTGQLVHDCGVYAMRIAYMLSLLRDHPQLKLRFRYIWLPVHIGLIISGDKLPTYFIHNDTFIKFDQADLAALRAKWNLTDRQGNQIAPAAAGAGTAGGKAAKPPDPAKAAQAQKRRDDEFAAELAGNEFIPFTDLPYMVTEVPKLGLKSEKADKDILWSNYTALARKELFSDLTRDPKSPYYQFHLNYLNVLEKIKQHYNQFVVPFWDDLAHPAWVKAKPKLEKAAADLKAARTVADRAKAEKAFDAAANDYFKPIETVFAKVDKAYSPITSDTAAITTVLQQHPEILARGIPKVYSDRLFEVFGRFASPFWARRFREHVLDLRARQLEPPPYAEKKDLLPLID